MTGSFEDFLRAPSGRVFKAKVGQALIRDFERLTEHLLGRPVRRGKREWRFSPGALDAVMTGPKRGSWVSRSSGGGGGPVELIRYKQSCDETIAWEWAGHFTGIEPEAKRWTEGERQAWIERQKRERAERQAKHAAARAREDAEAIAEARAIWEAAS